jgi:hypothetical protein
MLDETNAADWEYDPETLTTIVHVPHRDKRQSITITAFAKRSIVALGKEHNQAQLQTDLHRLLGDSCPSDVSDTRAVLQAAAGRPAQGDVIARLGGPLVRVIEFTAPEEAANQLGRVIVGVPLDGPQAGGTPYDLEVTWTLHRGSDPEQYQVALPGTNKSRLLDAPFAAGEAPQTAYWQADVSVTWQGETLRTSYTSAPLFPAITAWRAVVYDAEKEPIPLERALDDIAKVQPALDWRLYAQQIEGIRNLAQPHAVVLSRRYWQALQEGVPLAGYLAVTVHCPDEREAVLRFGVSGSATIYLNGRSLQAAPVESDTEKAFFRQELKRTPSFRLHKGANPLLVDTRPPLGGRASWVFWASLCAPDKGTVMTDLVFD